MLLLITRIDDEVNLVQSPMHAYKFRCLNCFELGTVQSEIKRSKQSDKVRMPPSKMRKSFGVILILQEIINILRVM